MNQDEQLVRMKKDIESLKVKKIQLNERLKALEVEKDSLLQECATLNVEPTRIGETIQTLEQSLSVEVQQISEILLRIRQSSGPKLS
jgi:chromosome segregation ATPase